MGVSTILDQHKMDRNLSYYLNDLFSGNRSDAASDLESSTQFPEIGSNRVQEKTSLASWICCFDSEPMLLFNTVNPFASSYLHF